MRSYIVKSSLISLSTALVIGISGCSNSDDSSADASLDLQSGVAIDGVLSGSRVCIDVNENSLCDLSEDSNTTNSLGEYKLYSEQRGPLYLFGGNDLGTGLPFSGSLKAPQGSKVITPLTSALQAMIENGSSKEEAERSLKVAMGIPLELSLTTFNPLEEISGAKAANAKIVLEKQAQLQTLVHGGSTALAAVSSEQNISTTMDELFSELSRNFQNADGEVEINAEKLQTATNAAAKKIYAGDTSKQDAIKRVAKDAATNVVNLANTTAQKIKESAPSEATDIFNSGMKTANEDLEEELELILTTTPYASKVAATGAKLPYRVLDETIIDGASDDNSTMEIRNGGFGSAAAVDPKNPNRFYALTDRGPNAVYNIGADGSGKMFPTPDYTPRVGHFEIQEDGSVTKIDEILLKDRSGKNITGLPNSSSLGGTGETPYDKDGNSIKNSDGTIKTDDYGIDTEGLAIMLDGTFWVSDEYGPHIVHYDATGKEIGRINPFADDVRNSYTLPAEFQNRRANRGMEGLTVTPDQKSLVGIMQSTMYNPSSAVKTLDITRIVSLNLETGKIGQYLYKQEKAANSNSEIVALSSDTFLIIERDGSFAKDTADGQKQVYKITLSSGTNLEELTLGEGMVQDESLGLTLNGLTLEEAVLDLEGSWDRLLANGIFPVSKSLVVDMIEENGYPHDKMEGLIVFDENTLGVINDDDFATWSSAGVLEQKYLDEAKTIIDGNTLYVVKDVNLSSSEADEKEIKTRAEVQAATEKAAAIANVQTIDAQRAEVAAAEAEAERILALQKSPLEISIIHVNDTHSHLASDSYSLTFDGVTTEVELGGYPRVVSKIKELQGSKTNPLTLNAGDTFQGTLYYSLFKGEADSDMLNMIRWDAFELGNHEFDDGDEALAKFLGDFSTSPIIGANVEAAQGSVLEGMWSPYVIKEYDGKKVAIIGIDIKQKTEVSSNPSDAITFYNELETAQKYIDEVSANGVNKIVLLTHQGYENDKSMASMLYGVDVIIGGDSHTLLGDYSAVGLVNEEGYDYPTQTTNANGERVCIAQAWQYAYAVGNMDVSFDASGVVSSCEGEAVLLLGDTFIQEDADGNDVEVDETTKTAILSIIDSNDNLEIVAEDNATLTKLQTYTDKVDSQKNVVIGSASEFLGHNRVPGDMNDGKSNLPLGSDIAPIVAKSFYDLSNRADACIQNAGGVRMAVEEGNITMGSAYSLLPFANTLFEIEMRGSEIKQVLEDALTNYIDDGGSTGAFPYAYGLRYDINTKAAANSRISNLEIKDRESGVWADIVEDTMYVIVTNSYTGGGKDGYLTFKTVQDERGEGVDTYLDYAMSFVRYVEAKAENNESVTKLPSEDHCIKSFNKALTKLGSYKTDTVSASEIVAYDTSSQRMFTTNGAENKIDIIDITDVTNPTLLSQIDLAPYGTGVNSVAAQDGKVAVAVEIKSTDGLYTNDKGKVVIFDAYGEYEQNVTVGYLPDMLTFNEDGTKIIVANEGEPNGDYSFDPIGSIGIVTLADSSYVDINFSNATLSPALDMTQVRLGATPSDNKALDIEPEYIAVSGEFAYVTLQENNAMAKIDLRDNSLTYVKSYGAKSWEADSNNTIDIEEDGEIKMKSYKGLYGLYMPDSIAAYSVEGSTYLVTANEGDGREYPIEKYSDDLKTGDALTDEKKISKLDLDSSIESEYEDDNDLKVLIDMGDTDNDGLYEKLYSYGARSFSIWSADGDIIFDSGDEISKKVALYEPTLFNQDEGEMDGRSGNKGAEPEALTVGTIDGKTYAFVGLERQNAIMVYDITTPRESKFVDYVKTGLEGDISAEGMRFVPASESPNGKNLLLVSFEVSGSTVVYEINKL